MALHARFEESQQQVRQLEKSLQALKVSARKRVTLAQMLTTHAHARMQARMQARSHAHGDECASVLLNTSFRTNRPIRRHVPMNSGPS